MSVAVINFSRCRFLAAIGVGVESSESSSHGVMNQNNIKGLNDPEIVYKITPHHAHRDDLSPRHTCCFRRELISLLPLADLRLGRVRQLLLLGRLDIL
ncbi:hypothetical protein Tco_0647962 [Tanacetum coccineum]